MMYAISRLVRQELATRGWRMTTLVTAMGYKIVPRGLKRLESCLQQGDCANADMLSRLRSALGLSVESLNAVVAETRRQRVDEERARVAHEEAERRAQFRPYVFVRTSESRPKFLSAAAVIGPRLKYLQLDEMVLSLPRPLLLSRVAEMICEHYCSNLGKCLLFGEITGYALRIGYDETVEYTIDGSQNGERPGWTEEEGYAMLIVGEQQIMSGLFNRRLETR